MRYSENMNPQELAEFFRENRDKLPSWAKRHIEGLERQISSMTRRLDEVEKRADDSTLVRIRGFSGSPDIEVNRDATVTFKLGGRWDESISARLEFGKGGAPVGVWIETGSSIKIIPRASNCFLVKLDDR